jgi:uncharacterized membrane protein YcaP (DUF421 family)
VVILGFDIPAALIPDVSLFEIVIRGAVTYFSIFILLRVILKGRTSAVTVSDLLVLVLIADAAQNAMSAEYHSITAGIVLVATIVMCSVSVDWLAFRFEAFRQFVHPERKPLVVNGRVIHKALQEELITDGELMTQLRLNGVEEVEEVKAAYLEGNGEISVIKRRGSGESEGKQSSEGRAGPG